MEQNAMLAHRGALIRLISVFLLISPAVYAANNPNIYIGEATVAGQSEAERTSALGAALSQVLVKVSGRAELARDPITTSYTQRAAEFVAQYSYRQKLITGFDGQPVSRLQLVAEFSPSQIENILRDLNQPLWGPERPTVLVWLVIADGADRKIVSAAQASAVDALTQQAASRGLQLRFPAMDTDDAFKVEANGLWNGDGEMVMSGAARYRAPLAMVGRLSKMGSGWSGRFSLFGQGSTSDWTSTQADAASVLVVGANGLADRLAERYAIAAADMQPGDYSVVVEGIHSADDYGRAMRYLSALSAVRELQPEVAQKGKLVVKLSLVVSLERFRSLIALDNKMQFSDQMPAPQIDATLVLKR